MTVAIALFLALLVLVFGLIPLLAILQVARPWELRGGSWVDRLRVVEAVNNYDFWLSLRGVSGRRRRDLRDELRANLWEAARRVGGKEAVRAVGSTRRLAAGVTEELVGPRWLQGFVAGLIALEVVVAVQLLAATAWTDAAIASGVSRLEGAVVLLPGTHVVYEKEAAGGGFSFEASLGPACVVVGAVVFLLVARPWRRRLRVPFPQA